MTTQEDAAATGKPGVEELQAEVEQTRAELADTVDALAGKLDVKTRARARLDAGRDRAVRLATDARNAATDNRGRPTTPVIGGAAVAVLLVTGVVLVARRRSR